MMSLEVLMLANKGTHTKGGTDSRTHIVGIGSYSV